ncbi:MAG: tetratricopeptide repeat protein [Ferruginibacter sp.]
MFCFIFNIALTGASAQYVSIDSLRKIINTAKEDTVSIDAMNWMSFRFYQKGSLDSSVFFAKQALSRSEKINFKSGKGFAYLNIGLVRGAEWNIPLSLENMHKAAGFFEEAGNKAYLGVAYNGLAATHFMEDNYPATLETLYKALKLNTESGYKFGLAHCYFVFGIYYTAWKNFKEADENFQKAINLFQPLGEKHSLSHCFSYKGDIALESGKYQEALENFTTAKNISMELGSPGWIHSLFYGSVASVYEKQGDSAMIFLNIKSANEKYRAAEKNYLAATTYAKTDDTLNLPYWYSSIGGLYCKIGKITEAKKYLVESIRLARTLNSIEILKTAYLHLSFTDSIGGNFKQAYDNFKKHIYYRDSLFNEESIRKTEGYKMQYQFEIKEEQIKLLSAENKLKTVLASRQKQQKNFALTAIVAILLFGGFGFYRYRRSKKLQSQRAILSERLRISSELHDEVGATLSGIAMYSHLTKEQMKSGQTAEIEKSLNVMQQSSVKMVDKLSDIVWLINPEQDSLKKLVTRLEEYATDMAAIKNMQVKISVPEKIADINLPVENRRNIYLFCKEAINNAVKYSNASLLELTVKEVNGKVKFSVSDNGKGFDAVMVRRGNGLENMQKRADEIGAKLILQSKEKGGASVCLQCKIT